MKKIYDLIIRYTILILAGISNFYIFYLIFTPLTIYPVYLLFSLFFKTTLIGKTILVNKILIELIPACIAGSAYYLLLILNLSIPNIKIKKRIEMIAFAFSFFLIINVLRIFFLGFIYDSTWFDFAHKFFWYFLSIVFVIIIWFTEVRIFKIKQIPFYTDLRNLYKKSKC